MRVGDVFNARINISACREWGGAVMLEELVVHEGRIIYIHPKNRFVTVEFKFPVGKIRECYSL